MTVVGMVKEFLVKEEYLEANESVEPDESLLERGLIDSVGIMKLVPLLEEKFGIEIDDDDLMPENFDSLEAIEQYVNSKVG